MLEKIENVIARIVNGMGYFLALVLLLMTLNVSFDVMMRYVFHNSSVGMQEMEWHLFSVMILFGVGYALQHEAHVRVDFIYDHMSQRTKSIINITGTLLFLIPLAVLILTGSYGFVHDSFISHEISDDPGGLPYRWVIKAMIPLSMGFLLLSAAGYVLQNIRQLRGKK